MEGTHGMNRSPATTRPRAVVIPSHNHNDNQKFYPLVERALYELTQLNPTRQAAVGGVSGMAAGYCFAKASKMVAFAIGGSILALAIARQSGYVDIHFDRIRDSAQQQLNNIQRTATAAIPSATMGNVNGEIGTFLDETSSVADTLKRFATENLTITASFVGGFLLGCSFS